MNRASQFARCWPQRPAQPWNIHARPPLAIAGLAVVNPYAAGVTVPLRTPYLARRAGLRPPAPGRGWRRRGLAGLGDASGAISGAEAYRQAKAAESNLNPKDYASNPNFADDRVGAMIEAFQIPLAWTAPSGCSGQPAPKLSIFTTASGLAVGVAGSVLALPGVVATSTAPGLISATAGAIASGALIGVGVAVAIFSIIHAHHAAAVARDQSAICALYPAMANTLEAVHDAVLNGTMAPAQGIAALTPMPGLFVQYAGAAYNHHPFCNALCEAKILLDGFVRYWVGQFQAMQATQAAQSATPGGAVTSAISSAAAQTGLPPWVFWAGIAFLAWEFL